MDLRIRPATVADLAQVLALCRHLDLPGEPALSAAQAEVRLAAPDVPDRHCIYVAQAQSQTVGTFAMTFIAGLAHSGRDACIVEDVVVAPEQRGIGIGKQMMKFAMAECMRRDCYKLTLSSHLARDAAHRFYEALGFRKHGFSFLIEPRS